MARSKNSLFLIVYSAFNVIWTLWLGMKMLNLSTSLKSGHHDQKTENLIQMAVDQAKLSGADVTRDQLIESLASGTTALSGILIIASLIFAALSYSIYNQKKRALNILLFTQALLIPIFVYMYSNTEVKLLSAVGLILGAYAIYAVFQVKNTDSYS